VRVRVEKLDNVFVLPPTRSPRRRETFVFTQNVNTFIQKPSASCCKTASTSSSPTTAPSARVSWRDAPPSSTG
jgi:hypothetical protein